MLVSVFISAPSTCWTAFEMEGARSGEAAVEAIPATIKPLLLKVIALSSVVLVLVLVLVLVRVRVLVLIEEQDKDENCSSRCGDSGSLTFMSLKEKALTCIVSETTAKNLCREIIVCVVLLYVLYVCIVSSFILSLDDDSRFVSRYRRMMCDV